MFDLSLIKMHFSLAISDWGYVGLIRFQMSKIYIFIYFTFQICENPRIGQSKVSGDKRINHVPCVHIWHHKRLCFCDPSWPNCICRWGNKWPAWLPVVSLLHCKKTRHHTGRFMQSLNCSWSDFYWIGQFSLVVAMSASNV